jgi:hypothetical protein
MATAWPTVTDVQNLLRVQAGDVGDDNLVTTDLAAAIAWVQNRVDPQYLPPTNTEIPNQLFAACQYEASRLYRRRDSVDGTIGWGDMGVVRVGPKDPDIETLLGAYLAIVIG